MEFDWSVCVICQQKTSEALKCPLENPVQKGNKAEAYTAFLKNVKEFRDIDALPSIVKFGCNETAENFAFHRASWHKSCLAKFNNCKLQRAKKKRELNVDESEEKPRFKRQALDNDVCFLCEKGTDEGGLHQVSTFDADTNIRTMITELNDSNLLVKIVGGDLIAIGTKYHLKCLVDLRNRYRSCISKSKQDDQSIDENMNNSRVSVELTSYIEKEVDSGRLLFKLSELHSLYENRLEDLGHKKSVNKTRLKERFLEHFKEAQEQSDGKNTILVFNEGMRNMIKEALKKRDFSEDADILGRAASIIRKDIFGHEGFKFDGSFTEECQQTTLPSSLKTLISLIFNGTNLKCQDKHETQACLTVGQLIAYNIKKRSTNSGMQSRHSLEREPPLPIYIGLNIHGLTRSKLLIQQLHQLGICVSYDRVMELEDWIATAMCGRFDEDGVVSPACLRKGLFTVGALDNLDHNPTSTTSQSSFHGTGISLFQFPTSNKPGECRPPVTIPPSASRKQVLPESYSTVPAVAITNTTISVPKVDMKPVKKCLDEAKQEENEWVESSVQLLKKAELERGDAIAWAAYHASQQLPMYGLQALCALLPLFYEKSATPAMVKHGMDVQRQAIQFLNPGQIPVTTFDQPLFALAKLVQWQFPTTHGEAKYVVMLGGLHTEMALWNTLGDLLEGSGWTSALTEAEITSAGTAESMLKAAHLTRTRHAHQVTLLALQILEREAFLLSKSSEDEEQASVWRIEMIAKSPTFMFWDLILRYQALILIFIHAYRQKNFPLYVNVLEELTPLFFALDHVNYSRWLPVHIRDMKSLPQAIKVEFETQGNWVISKTSNAFSAIPFDQAHEQENRNVKGSGGCIGLTENPVAFRRWMLSGPELSRLQKQFEREYFSDNDPDNPQKFRNHEQGLSTQKTFQRQVISLCNTIRKMGNPFLADFPDLVSLDSRDCTDESVIVALRSLEDIGKKQYQNFVKDVFEERTRSIHDPIKRNSLALFRKPTPKTQSKQGKKIKVLQNNVSLFGQLYISMQSREGDLEEFFSHEVQSFPPSLSEFGKLYLPGTKSELMKCIEPLQQSTPPETFECIVLDGAVVVHCLPITGITTFNEYAEEVFIPHLEKELQGTARLDVVWDTYSPESLKDSTREKRGKGVRRKVSGETKLPRNWMDFLRDSLNKKELFAFLTSKVANFVFPQGKAVYITADESVVAVCAPSPMPNCNHEEADTRIVIHVTHALQQGWKIVKVRTVDTDVIVVLVGVFHRVLQSQPLADIWVAFGVGKSYRLCSINAICNSLGASKSQALPMMHALSGCDTTSGFRGKGKKSFWQAWLAFEEVTETLAYLASHPFESLDADCEHFRKIERLIVIVYHKASTSLSINQTRRELFCLKNAKMEKMPPTQNALLQHTRRAVYQASIWATSTETQQVVPSPAKFAWEKEASAWVPVWLTVQELSKACQELIKCACKGDCSKLQMWQSPTRVFTTLQL